MHKVLPPIITIFLICCILFFLGLGNRGLWVPDETRYVAVAKEMVNSGDWITLRLNGVIYREKPPVFFWLISVFSILFGKFSEFSSRFPSAIAGLGCALVTYLFAKKLFDNKVALLSSLILITSLAYLGASRWVILDPLLTFFAVSAIYLFYVGLTQQNKRLIAYVFAFALMALGTLTKGPVGFILPLLVTIIYASFEKKLRSFFTKECLLGFLLFLLIILSWLIPACLKGGEAYAKELLLKQIFGRYFKAFSHKEPLYFYFVRFPAEFLPWTVFLPSATAFLLKNKIKEANVKFIFIWFATIFLFFTFSASKNDLYILPAYPAASMAIAYCWENGLSKKWRPFFIYIIAFMVILNTILTYLILPYFDKYKSTKYFSQSITKYPKPNQQLTTFQTSPVHWLFYCNRRQIEEIDDYNKLNEYLKSKERVFCIIENNKYEEFKRSYKVDAHLLDSARFGRKKTFAIISNKVK
ncbi:MAG: glycosyltransferase family 39 protein [Candidatus Omnitrophota bacterium]